MIDYKTYTKTIDENGKPLRLYTILQLIKSRCRNANDKDYKLYGGRGVKVCYDWANDYQSFRVWAINNGYSDDLTIDRIDCDGNYEPNNCRWVSMKVQNNNRRNNHFITINNVTKTLTGWCEELNLNVETVKARINTRKIDPLIALEIEKPYRCKYTKYFTWKGEEKSYAEWCEITGEKLYNVYSRINKLGWEIERALGLV